MGLFRRKPRIEKLDHKKRSQNSMTSFDKIVYMVIKDSSKETLFDISDKLLSSIPVLANFENIDIDSANDMLAFLSGVIYAKDGRLLKIQSKLFLLAIKEEFDDGSLYEYYEDLK